MNICEKIDFDFGGKTCTFIRVRPEDLSVTIRDILLELGNYSWLSSISNVTVRKSFETRSNKTVVKLTDKFQKFGNDDMIKKGAGEYIVSMLSKKAIVQNLSHSDIPLMELLGRKVTGNPGFDFYTEGRVKRKIIFCGEAKYRHEQNAHNESIKQSITFLEESKHIDDLLILEHLTSNESRSNLINGVLGSSMGFSIKDTTKDNELIENIKNNKHFIKLIQKCASAVFVGVELS